MRKLEKKPLAFIACVTLIAMTTSAIAGIRDVDEALVDYRLGFYNSALTRLMPYANDQHPDVLFWVGSLHHKGRGIVKNPELAIKYYSRAAYLGNLNAQNNLGLLYRDGLGVPRNKHLAYAWFSIASQSGHRIAEDNRVRLHLSMSTLEINRANVIAQAATNKVLAAIAQNKNSSPTPDRHVWLATTLKKSDMAPKKTSSLPAAKTTKMPPTTLASFNTSATLKEKRQPLINATSPELVRIEPAPESIKIPDTRKTVTPVMQKSQHYMVQLGIFRSDSGVAKISQKAQKRGFLLDQEKIVVGGIPHTRIRHGQYKSAAKAREVAVAFNKLFQVNSLVMKRVY